MRRLALTATALGLVVAVVAVLVLAVGGGDDRYRVAASFDTAKGIVAGQQVKIAGAVVGRVDAVELDAAAKGPKARIVLDVEERFAPFRADARCSILPEGLISESFVECRPGSARAALAPGADGTPTVPVERTSVPFGLQDVIEVLALPTSQRLQVLISQLGIATGGRGPDINALLRRANPALQRSQETLEIVDAQRARIEDAIGDTDRVLATLARRDGELRTFVDRAATVAQTTAQRRDALAAAVRRLPPMLAAVRPGLRSLDRAVSDATPLLGDLERSAPALTQLTRRLPAFADAGTPALRTLGRAAAAGRPALRDALPVLRRLGAVSGPLQPLARDLDTLLVSSREKGALEGVLKLLYVFATNTAMTDRTSHAFAAYVDASPKCILSGISRADVPGCSRKFSSPGKGLVPINHPDCGPQDPAWHDKRCSRPLPGSSIGDGLLNPGVLEAVQKPLRDLLDRHARGRGSEPEDGRGLLDVLLK